MIIYVESGNVLKEIKIFLQGWKEGNFSGEGRWSEDYSNDWYYDSNNKVFTEEQFEDFTSFLDEEVERLEKEGGEWRWDWEQEQIINDPEWIEDIKNGIII